MVVSDYTVEYKFSNPDGRTHSVKESYDPEFTDQSEIDDREQELLDELNEDCDDCLMEWDIEGFGIVDYDSDYDSPNDFDDLTEYSEFAQNISQHGEPYKMRYDDQGDCATMNNFVGTYESAEQYAREYSDSCGDIPSHLEEFIDWDSYAEYLLTDYSVYDGREGVHIFSDC